MQVAVDPKKFDGNTSVGHTFPLLLRINGDELVVWTIDAIARPSEVEHFLVLFELRRYYQVSANNTTSFTYVLPEDEEFFSRCCTTICAYVCHLLYVIGFEEGRKHRLTMEDALSGYQSLITLILHNLSCVGHPPLTEVVEGFVFDSCLDDEELADCREWAWGFLETQEWFNLQESFDCEQEIRREQPFPTIHDYHYPVTKMLLKIQHVDPGPQPDGFDPMAAWLNNGQNHGELN